MFHVLPLHLHKEEITNKQFNSPGFKQYIRKTVQASCRRISEELIIKRLSLQFTTIEVISLVTAVTEQNQNKMQRRKTQNGPFCTRTERLWLVMGNTSIKRGFWSTLGCLNI